MQKNKKIVTTPPPSKSFLSYISFLVFKIFKIIIIIVSILLTIVIVVILVGAVIPYFVSTHKCQTLGALSSEQKDTSINSPSNSIVGYKRAEESTYLTFPEWYIVY